MVASGVVTVAVAAALLSWSGAMTPHIRWEIDGFFVNADVDQDGILSTDLFVDVENEGVTPFTLTDISLDIPGLLLLPADEANGEEASATVESSGRDTMRRRLVITDCAAVPHEPQPIRFTYTTWMGSGTEEVIWNSWTMRGPGQEAGTPVAWQRGLAGKACNDAVSSDW